MTEEFTYGQLFIDRLRALSRQSQFNYSDLQAIKTMNQHELAAKLSLECKKAGEIVLNNPAADAAKLVYQKQVDASRANSTTSKVEGSLGLLEAIVNLWSIAN